MEQLKTQLKKQIIETLNLEEILITDIDDNAPLFGEGLGLDSIDALELIVLLEREYGINESTIRGWVKKYGTITTSTGETTNNDEILKLKKELQQVQIENEILKKAVAIFSKEQKIK